MIYREPMPTDAETVGISSFVFYRVMLFNAKALINNGEVL
jgi:hypothetical protein